MRSVTSVLILGCCLPASALAGVVDDLTSINGWITDNGPGFVATDCQASEDPDMPSVSLTAPGDPVSGIKITMPPRAGQMGIGCVQRAAKMYTSEFGPQTFLHFRVMASGNYIGSNAYMGIAVCPSNTICCPEPGACPFNVAQIHLNGVDHWRPDGTCTEYDRDYKVNISQSAYWNPDPLYMNHGVVNYPTGWLNEQPVWASQSASWRYFHPTIYSIKFDESRLRFYVNGREVEYRNLMAVGHSDPPQPQALGGYIDTRTPFVPGSTYYLQITIAVQTDGKLVYDPTKDPPTYFNTGCVAEETPARFRVPGDTEFPFSLVPEPATTFWDWIIIGNGRRSEDIRSAALSLMYDGRALADPNLELVPSTTLEQFCQYIGQNDIYEVKRPPFGIEVSCPHRSPVYSQEFPEAASLPVSSPQCQEWHAFRDRLTSNVYTSITVQATPEPYFAGQKCEGPNANTLCQAIRNRATVAGLSCDGHIWNVVTTNGETEVTIDALPGVCSTPIWGDPIPYTVRPCSGNSAWGALKFKYDNNGVALSDTCSNQPTQRMTVSCYSDSWRTPPFSPY